MAVTTLPSQHCASAGKVNCKSSTLSAPTCISCQGHVHKRSMWHCGCAAFEEGAGIWPGAPGVAFGTSLQGVRSTGRQAPARQGVTLGVYVAALQACLAGCLTKVGDKCV